MQHISQCWWIQFIVTEKDKGGTTKETLVYCCYQDMVSLIYDECYDEVFNEDYFW